MLSPEARQQWLDEFEAAELEDEHAETIVIRTSDGVVSLDLGGEMGALAAAAFLRDRPDVLAAMSSEDYVRLMTAVKEQTGYPGEIVDPAADIIAEHNAGHGHGVAPA